MEESKLRLHHYSLFDLKGRPVISVCLLQDLESGTFTRGRAFCSQLDYGVLTKRRGYRIARGRALKAHKLGKSILPIRRSNTILQMSRANLKGGGVHSNVKGDYHCLLTMPERNMVSDRTVQEASWRAKKAGEIGGWITETAGAPQPIRRMVTLEEIM